MCVYITFFIIIKKTKKKYNRYNRLQPLCGELRAHWHGFIIGPVVVLERRRWRRRMGVSGSERLSADQRELRRSQARQRRNRHGVAPRGRETEGHRASALVRREGGRDVHGAGATPRRRRLHGTRVRVLTMRPLRKHPPLPNRWGPQRE